MMVSVLLITYNEANDIKRCLESVSWCDDVICVDSGSADETLAILKQYNVRVLTRTFDNFAAQRNFGLEKGTPKYDWVLHLDADEVVTQKFKETILALNAPASVDAYDVPSKLMFGSSWLRYSGMFPTYQVRLGRRGILRFKQVGHGQQEDIDRSRVAVFPEPYLHFNFSKGLQAWFQKHVRYASDEAIRIDGLKYEASSHEQRSSDLTSRRRRLKRLADMLPIGLRPISRFAYVYLIRSGWRDGKAGFLYALLLMIYEAMIVAFIIERSLKR